MQYRSVKGYTGFGQLGVLIAFIGGGLILAAVAQMIIALQILPANVSAEQMGDAMMKSLMLPENIAFARLAQVLGTFFLMFIPAVMFSWVVHGRNPYWLGFNKYVNVYQVIIGFGIIFLANIVSAPLADISKTIVANFPDLDALAKQIELAYEKQVLALSNLKSWPEFLMAIVIMAFFPALFEEMLFRGAIQNLLERWWKLPIIAIIVTSLLFSLVHMSVYLFVSRAVLGFVLGYMYYRTRNIWVNVFAHFANNTIAVAQLFWLSRSGEKPDLSSMDPKVEWWVALICFAILIMLVILLKRYSVSNVQKIRSIETQLEATSASIHDPFIKR